MLTPEEREKLRARCRGDLFFLGRDILGKDLYEQPHRLMCDFFVHKGGASALKDLADPNEGLELTPRGSFKSTLNAIDCVQWIICFPDIRILVLTAEKSLGLSFVDEIRNYFVVQPEGPTPFQELFPEFCIDAGERVSSLEFTTPARRTYRKEPTVWANSIGANLPGWHCDVLKADDVVNDTNAADGDQITKIRTRFNMARKLVDPGGFIDVIGTPYDPEDLYGSIQKEGGNIRFLKAGAWRSKAGADPTHDLSEEDADLFFPARLTHSFLARERKRDPASFATQYLCIATAGGRLVFSDPVLDGAIIPAASRPRKVLHYGAWDLGYKQRRNSDLSVGAIGSLDEEGRLYLEEVICGRWTGLELAYQIAAANKKWELQITAIEDVLGAQWLAPEIERAALMTGRYCRVDWTTVDNTENAKFLRISGLAPLLESGRLYFLDSCSSLETALEQFRTYTGRRGAHDDIVDAISMLRKYVPEHPAQPPEDAASMRSRMMYDRIFGTGSNAPVYESEPEPEPLVINYF